MLLNILKPLKCKSETRDEIRSIVIQNGMLRGQYATLFCVASGVLQWIRQLR